MELRRYLAILAARKWLVLATIFAALVAGYLALPDQNRYGATASIYVGATQVTSDDLSLDRTNALSRLVLTFATMTDSRPVATKALELTGVARSAEAVVAQTTTEPVLGTQLFTVTVTDTDPTVARTLANGLADAFVEEVRSIDAATTSPEAATGEPTGSETGLPQTSLPVAVFERAETPVQPLPTDATQSLAVAGAFGVVAAAGLAFLLDYLDLRISDPDEAERRLGLVVLGAIPQLVDPTPSRVARVRAAMPPRRPVAS